VAGALFVVQTLDEMDQLRRERFSGNAIEVDAERLAEVFSNCGMSHGIGLHPGWHRRERIVGSLSRWRLMS